MTFIAMHSGFAMKRNYKKMMDKSDAAASDSDYDLQEAIALSLQESNKRQKTESSDIEERKEPESVTAKDSCQLLKNQLTEVIEALNEVAPEQSLKIGQSFKMALTAFDMSVNIVPTPN